jgi:hypothetical protein
MPGAGVWLHGRTAPVGRHCPLFTGDFRKAWNRGRNRPRGFSFGAIYSPQEQPALLAIPVPPRDLNTFFVHHKERCSARPSAAVRLFSCLRRARMPRDHAGWVVVEGRGSWRLFCVEECTSSFAVPIVHSRPVSARLQPQELVDLSFRQLVENFNVSLCSRRERIAHTTFAANPWGGPARSQVAAAAFSKS